mgnify:CR=1 FL=1
MAVDGRSLIVRVVLIKPLRVAVGRAAKTRGGAFPSASANSVTKQRPTVRVSFGGEEMVKEGGAREGRVSWESMAAARGDELPSAEAAQGPLTGVAEA